MCAWEVTYANGTKEVFQDEPTWAQFDPMLKVSEISAHTNERLLEFESIARKHGFVNFKRNNTRYCHNDLNIFHLGWIAAKSTQQASSA